MLRLLILAIFGSLLNQQCSGRYLEIETRKVSQILQISNPYHAAGVWGPIDLCPENSFVTAIEVKYNPPSHLDETALNGIKLYCSNITTGQSTGYVLSSEGGHGSWYGMQICSSNYVTGFRANVLEYQGPFTDDVAIENIEVECNYGEEIVPGLPITVPTLSEVRPLDFRPGTWGTFAACSVGSAVCGLQTRYEDASLGDETSICDAVLYCCDQIPQ